MKTKVIAFAAAFLSFAFTAYSQKTVSSEQIDYVTAFKDTLSQMATRSDNDFFKMHCNSIIDVIESKTLTASDQEYIKAMYTAFNTTSTDGNEKDINSYLQRKRPMILAWESPTDGEISYSLLKLPKDWDPNKEYPLYIELHGLWDVAGDKIRFMAYPYSNSPSTTFAFEDGYQLNPWGRGNLWYQGVSETDIWECIDALDALVKINPYRKYLCGHSMGGYGAWSIANKSPDVWAALGIHAGALWYDNASLVTMNVASNLEYVPTYFVCGTQDGLLDINETAYGYLQSAGNDDIEFVTFEGGHEYLTVNVENMYLWMKDWVNDDFVSSLKPDFSDTENVRIFPNPCVGGVQINYSLQSPGFVKVDLISQNGELIKVLVNEYQSAGEQAIKWKVGYDLPEGVYWVKVTENQHLSVQKLIYLND
jgi:predicted esterase